MKSLLAFSLLFLLSACAGGPFADRRLDIALEIGKEASLTPTWVQAGEFLILTQVRFKDPYKPLRIYIEGDGFAFRQPGKPSADPSPRDPVALRLAAVDETPNVAWVARPCQFVALARKAQTCPSMFWTTHRMAAPVIDALDTALHKLMQQSGAQGVELVGYSGGGAAAVLLAARNKAVLNVRTLAGNLDNAAFTRHHRVRAMPASLDAIDVAPVVRNIPQVHFFGAKDEIVPPTLSKRFIEISGAKSVVVPDATHASGWEDVWPDLLAVTF